MLFHAQGLLLDIEGTTSSVSFVFDIMFPLVRRELAQYLSKHWDDRELQLACDQIARDANHASVAAWCGPNCDDQRENVIAEVIRLMDGDVKATGLKQLQGLIWRSSFESGELKAHVYDEVPSCLQSWHDNGFDVRIYSSGSVQSQKLFFGHTVAGNLLPWLNGHYDTTVGSKRESPSYTKIVEDFAIAAGQILFVSDIVQELDAARDAGLQTCLCVRPENAPVGSQPLHPVVRDFREVVLAGLDA